MKITWIALALAICACSAPARDQPAATAITNVHVLDGRGGTDAPLRTVIIENGMISAVLPADVAVASSRRVIDGESGYLLPGFIDAHVHILVPRCEENDARPLTFDRALSEHVLSTLLDSGITTVRSPATPTIEGLALRDDLDSGAVRGPYALASAEFINDSSLSPDALRAIVRAAMPYRPDYFKVYAALSPEQIATVIDEAHGNGVPVIGHLGRTSWRQGAELGIDFLTHAVDWSEETLPPDRREAYRAAKRERGAIRARLDWLELLDLNSVQISQMIDALVAHHIPVDPTLVAYDAKFSAPDYPRYRNNPNVDVVPEVSAGWRACPSLADDWTEEDFARWRRLFPKMQALVRMMHDRGVVLMTGSDTTNEWVIPGESLHQEFELLVETGIPASEVLRMTGEGTADALGLNDRGVIAPGRRADLVLLLASPLEDIRNTRRIAWVMQAGVLAQPSGPRPSEHR